jgi:serine/threonine protein kinase
LAGVPEEAGIAGNMQPNEHLIANRFRFRNSQSDLLGRGGMGEVYHGIDLETGEDVAIKVLKPDLVASDPELVERFNRECQALRQLNHPNIVKMLSAVTEQDPATGTEIQYLVMEYVGGGSLQDLLDQQHMLPIQQVLKIGLELADALSRAHHLNIIHRDLKPANVLLAQDGTPRLSDFGIARFADRPRLTQTGALVGSVGYLSPEVCSLQQPDARADIWAFGVMLFEMLSGEHPFISEGLSATLMNILNKPTPHLSRYREDIPTSLIELVNQMLAKDREQRIPSARLVAARLEAILQNHETLALPQQKVEPVVEDQGPKALDGSMAIQELSSRQPAVLVNSAVRRNQLILLEKVKSFWIRGVLEQCVPQGALIDVQKQRADQAIESPWGKVLESAGYRDQDDPARKSTLEFFFAADRSMLILGDPGSGKTITLLALAHELACLAEKDPAQPIPVVLNLVSWLNKRGDLANWVVEELTAKYQIPRKMGRDWLDNNGLLLLLDGLDEIPARYLLEIIAAINNFRETNGLTGLIVCSRTDAYESTGMHLKLGGAVKLLPLTGEQIEWYLASDGSNLGRLHAAFQNDTELERIAKTPLWLNLMSVTYRDTDPGTISGLLSDENVFDSKIRRQRLMQAYVQHAFQRRIQQSPYGSQQTNHWLTWLSKQLFAHNQAVYLVEQMQPNWLPTPGWRLVYMLITGAIKGLWIGVMVWLMLRAFNQEYVFNDILPGSEIYLNFLAVISLNLALGLLFGLGHGWIYQRRGQEMGVNGGKKEVWIRALVMGIGAFAVAGFLQLLFGVNEAIALFGGLWIGAFFLLLTINTGSSYDSAIENVEALSWDWRQATRQIPAGLGVGTTFTIIQMLSWFPLELSTLLPMLLRFCVSNIAPWTLMFFVMGGLRGRRVEKRSRVNQGIKLSARNAGFAGLLSMSVLSTFLLAFDKFYNVSYSLALWLGLVIGLFVTLQFGGNVLDHFVLRLILWAKNCLPGNLVRFLDYAAELSLMRKVGGGYIFSSRLLQEYYYAQK